MSGQEATYPKTVFLSIRVSQYWFKRVSILYNMIVNNFSLIFNGRRLFRQLLNDFCVLFHSRCIISLMMCWSFIVGRCDKIVLVYYAAQYLFLINTNCIQKRAGRYYPPIFHFAKIFK